MSQIIMMMLTIINSFLFSFSIHPMNMGMLLLMQTFLMCMMMGLLSQTTWFSYILFLVFLGGMLVLFIYMTSIASNEIFKKSNYILTIISLMMVILISCCFMEPFILSYNNTEEITNMFNSDNILMTPLYSKPFSNITIFAVLYLFLTLIVIVYITKSNKGPLRPLN